jgi:UDPglucose--hexose-1-phosphate uridylyltransferase
MPELRHDPIQKRWVIIATERSRPPDPPAHPPDLDGALCPFCEGNEHKTPPEIIALRPGGSAPNQPGWQVRVVPNKFPALRIEGDLERRAAGIYDRMNGVGAHEVIIETPRHDLHLADMPVEQVARVIWTYRERLVDLLRDARFKYVLVFKNHGLAAGASLAHPHTQVIATPVTPLTLSGELQSAKEHFHHKERCLFCDILAQELESGERIVAGSGPLVAFAPFASRFPFEVSIMPRQHHASFAEISDEAIGHLAATLRDVLRRMKRALNDPPFNFLIHTIPNVKAPPRRSHYWETIELDYHWHLELMPRLTRIAGFEWGTGFYINPTAPEHAAKYLREIEL